MKELLDVADPVRDAMAHGESAPVEFASWPTHEVLRRLRVRFSLTRKESAARAGVSASRVGRAEKGADIRLSTLRRLFAAVGCRVVILPAGALYDMDWTDAHLDDECLDWKREVARAYRYYQREREGTVSAPAE